VLFLKANTQNMLQVGKSYNAYLRVSTNGQAVENQRLELK
jgi:hypothetical protein